MCFLVKFAKFLKTPILKNICEGLVLILEKRTPEKVPLSVYLYIFFSIFILIKWNIACSVFHRDYDYKNSIPLRILTGKNTVKQNLSVY